MVKNYQPHEMKRFNSINDRRMRPITQYQELDNESSSQTGRKKDFQRPPRQGFQSIVKKEKNKRKDNPSEDSNYSEFHESVAIHDKKEYNPHSLLGLPSPLLQKDTSINAGLGQNQHDFFQENKSFIVGKLQLR